MFYFHLNREIIIICGILWLLSGFFTASALAGNTKKEAAALDAAQKWLTIVDNEQYEQSWNLAAKSFQGAVHASKWEQSAKAVRFPLGTLLSRKVSTKIYTTTLPGSPDGEYVVFQFKASFTNKKNAIETVTAMIEIDGTWRVAGYYIK